MTDYRRDLRKRPLTSEEQMWIHHTWVETRIPIGTLIEVVLRQDFTPLTPEQEVLLLGYVERFKLNWRAAKVFDRIMSTLTLDEIFESVRRDQSPRQGGDSNTP